MNLLLATSGADEGTYCFYPQRFGCRLNLLRNFVMIPCNNDIDMNLCVLSENNNDGDESMCVEEPEARQRCLSRNSICDTKFFRDRIV